LSVKGYNHYFIIDGWQNDGQLRTAARLHDPQSGRTLTVRTTLPGLMLYTGNWLDGSPVGKHGEPFRDYDGIALECQ
ncbi:MAG: galactose-1-epimerase, partial [Duncaniella sp.]|nr:galactose-1-epimerase [Duncaniella sp.]